MKHVKLFNEKSIQKELQAQAEQRQSAKNVEKVRKKLAKKKKDVDVNETFDSYNYKHVDSFQTYEGKIKIDKEKLNKIKKKIKKGYNKMAENPTSRIDLPKFHLEEE